MIGKTIIILRTPASPPPHPLHELEEHSDRLLRLNAAEGEVVWKVLLRGGHMECEVSMRYPVELWDIELQE